MKKLTTILVAFLCLLSIQMLAQNTVVPSGKTIVMPSKNWHAAKTNNASLGKTATCATDTIEYPLLKAAGLQGLNINSSASAAYQWYPAKQNITINGFSFFAFLNPSFGILNQLVTFNLYNAGVDSMPTGAPIRTTTMLIDTFLNPLSLNSIRKRVVFSSPITVNNTNGYVLAIENTSTNSIIVICNDWNTNDGNSEWNSSLKLGTPNLRSYNVNVGGIIFNSDFLFFPIISLSITTAFTTTPTCFTQGSAVSFVNTSSSVNFQNYYNLNKAFGTPQNSFTWDFGNGTGGIAVDTNVIYTSAGPFNVKLTDTLAGYYRNCFDSRTITLNQQPTAPVAGGAGSYCLGSNIPLTCATVAGATYSWTGPNGYTSSAQNPTRTNATTAMAGTYNVIVINGTCSSAVASVVVSILPQPTATNTSPVCFGQTVNFTASTIAGASYAWTGPRSFTSNLQNPSRTGISPLDTGLYSLSVTVPGCSFTIATTRVTGVALPNAPTLNSPINICEGSTINLTATSSYANATYAWTGPNSFTASTQNTSITSALPIATGTYSATLSFNGCTSLASSVAVTVNATPTTPTAGNNGALCAGQTLNLTASLVANASYYWTGPSGYTSTLQNPNRTGITSAMAGTYSVVAIIGSCSSAVATTVLVVRQQPEASNTSPTCFGQNVTLTATAIAGAAYAWSGPNSFSSSLQNPTRSNITPADTGLYNVIVTLAGCTFNPSNTRVSGLAIPATPTLGSAINSCIGSIVNLTANGTYTNPTYAWTGPNGYTSTAKNPSFTASNVNLSGSYDVTVTAGGCKSQSASVTVTVNTIPNAPTATSNGALCNGQTLSLSASLIANATYTWSGANGFSSNLQNPTKANVTTADAGLYSVYATLNGCNSSTSDITITVTGSAPIPVAASNSPVCAGKVLSLTASSIAGATYSWTGPNSFTSSQQNPVISSATSANSGTYSVSAFTSNCGLSSASSVSVTIISLPVTPVASNSGPICEGTSGTLNFTTINNATYNWTGPNNFISQTQNPFLSNVTKAMAGIYSITLSTVQCGVINTYNTELFVKQKPVITSVLNNTPLCTGDTLSISILGSNTSANATYDWVGPNSYIGTGKTIKLNNVSAANVGSYSVIASDSGCTSASFSTLLTIKTTPDPPTITNVSPLCEGTKLDLVASVIGSVTYMWNGPNNFTSTSRTPSINSISKLGEGIYKVYSILNGCKSTEASMAVTVNTIPATPNLLNNGPVCEGVNVTLSAPTVPNAGYAWTGPNNFTSSKQNVTLPLAAAFQSGTYNCVVTVANCSSMAGNTTLLVNATPKTPTLSSYPVDKMCAGDSLQLFSTQSETVSYDWSGPAGFSSTARNPVIKNTNLANGGTYNLTVSKNSCNSFPTTISIIINPTPNTGNISGLANVNKNDTGSYSVLGLVGSTFDWQVSNANVLLGANTNKIQVKWFTVGTGNIKVKETSNLGCVGSEKTFSVTINPTLGINEISNKASILIYPNPINETLHITMLGAKLSHATIYDLIGNEILLSNKNDIDVSQIQFGIYIIKVKDENGNVYTQKLIKN